MKIVEISLIIAPDFSPSFPIDLSQQEGSGLHTSIRRNAQGFQCALGLTHSHQYLTYLVESPSIIIGSEKLSPTQSFRNIAT
ncbi:MAG: hypothetical protein HDS17_06310 [Bacteroides sp.]|nr:hypothetical protein [Bacteroides sp.]